ncbi:hypothetical protein ACFX5E_15435 [Flavobacterium sp. LS2P90]|uniref:Rhodanese domain-containing protein n=1 Tax=Flavobacterium xylosi TaxID=3230415 RepID=A0ABW6HZK7_9FLAO
MEDKGILIDFVFNYNIVTHSGAPFILDVRNPQTELFDPTIKGPEIILEDIKNKFRIEKVVFIASVAAWDSNFLIPAARKVFTEPFDESDGKFTSPENHPV